MSQFNKDTVFKMFSVMEVLGMCLPSVKNFSDAPLKYVFLGLKLLKFSCFREFKLWGDQRSQYKNNRFF